MSGGQHEAMAMGELSSDLREAAYKMRDAVKAAEAGYRGWTVDIHDEVNKILLPSGWKLVRAEKVTEYR